MAIAWKELHYALEIKDKINDHPSIPGGKTRVIGLRCSHHILNKHLVDMLIVETGKRKAPQASHSVDHWE